ncbi:T9SS sorting signal type C domain-containing protein [Flavobacterium sp. SM15]|uniref:T9SS sorting signal type C domain-containing protein n=1 Tax=Flavobacterium sp. SM15 TaxID=2908005 RepID=UPI001EDA447B|nr:T9SS sorting signal type C domain-containing protein [Flavobacterium sp. SM15]MCG2610582.1 T9SS sorting signal type C domain-containing protein [Flavobacterium sp. SM15]
MQVCKITLLKGKYSKTANSLFLIFTLAFCFFGHAQSIQVTAVSPNPACSGQSLTVTFNATNGNGNPGHYTSSSTFTAYLSSVGGGTPYTSIGTLTISPYGFLPNNGDVNYGIQGTITLPTNLTGVYKIAVGSTSPTFNGSGGAGASINFNINTAPTAGAVTGGTTVCPGSNSTLLTLSGNTGTIDKWQSSTVSNFSTNVTDIANTASTYTANSVSVTTYYRAVVTNGTCPAYSSSTTLQVASGNVSANQNICFNTQPASISLSNYQGTILKWQKSTDNITYDDFIVTSSATLTSAQLGALAETTYYRVVVDGGVPCGQMISNVITVTVSTASIGGAISPSEVLPAVCPSSTTVLTLSGYTGSVIKWQSSPNSNFNTDVVDIFNYTNTLTITNVSTTTYYRALVTNGGCAGAISTKSKVNAITGGPTGGNLTPNSTALCSATNSTVLTLSGSTGTVQKWQSSSVSDFSSGVTDIANTTTSLTVTNLAATTYYRVVVFKNACTAYSSIATISVYPSLTASITGNNGPICSGANAVFNLTGTNNAIVTYTINGGSNQAVSLSALGTASVTVTGATVNQTLNLVSVSSGICSTTISGTSTVTVNSVPIASIAGNNGQICSGSNAIFNLTGTNNAVVTYTINGGSNQTVTLSASGTATVTLTAVSSNQTLNLVSVSLGCSTTLSGNSTVVVNASPTASISGNNSPVCLGANAIFNLSGTNNAVITYNINGGSNQTVSLSGSGTATVTLTAVLSNQTLNLVSVASGGCSASLSGNSTVMVNNSTTWTGAAADNQWGTAGNWSCNLVPLAGSDVIINSGTVIVSGVNALANTIALNGTATLTINSGNNISVTNAVNVAVGASFTLQNNANLLQVNNVVNSGKITVNRQSSSLMRLDYTLWSSPVATQNLLSFSPQTVTTRFYTYNSATNVYAAIVPSTNSFQLAKGYLIRMPDNHPTTPTKWNGLFNGVPNNGNVTFSAYNGGAGFRFNAIGNPYPSPVNMVSFVNGNSTNITGTLYFWRKTNNAATDPGYCTWTTAGFVGNGETQVVDPNGILRTGQGFLVEMIGSATSVNFTNSMRAADNANQFFRTSSENAELSGDRIWLGVENTSGANNQMLVGYFPSATLGMDYGIDGKSIEDAQVSLTMDVSGTNCIIQGRPAFDANDSVPLRLKTAYNGAHIISLDRYDGVFSGSQQIFLKDNLTNMVHDLKTSAYSFTSNAGTFADRFELVYQNTTLNTLQNDFNENQLVIYKEACQNLIIASNGMLLDKVEIFDARGRSLVNKSAINDKELRLSNLVIANQVLLIKAIAQNGAIVYKKVVF